MRWYSFNPAFVVSIAISIVGVIVVTLFNMNSTPQTRSIKVEDNTVTATNVPIRADVMLKGKDIDVKVYADGKQTKTDGKQVKKEYTPPVEIDWNSKPKILNGLGIEITGKEAEALFK